MGGERKKKTDIKTLPRRNYITYPVVTAFIIIVLIYIYIYEHGIVYKSFFVFFFCFKIDYSTELNYSAQRTRTYIYIVISGRQLIFAVVPPRGFRVRLPVLPVFNARLRRIRQNYSFLFFFSPLFIFVLLFVFPVFFSFPPTRFAVRVLLGKYAIHARSIGSYFVWQLNGGRLDRSNREHISSRPDMVSWAVRIPKPVQ